MNCELCHDFIPYPIPGQRFCSQSHKHLWDEFGDKVDTLLEALIDNPDGLTRQALFNVLNVMPSFVITVARLKYDDLMVICDRNTNGGDPIYRIPMDPDDAWYWLTKLAARRVSEMRNVMRYANTCADLYSKVPAGAEWQEIAILLGMVQRRFAIARLQMDRTP